MLVNYIIYIIVIFIVLYNLIKLSYHLYCYLTFIKTKGRIINVATNKVRKTTKFSFLVEFLDKNGLTQKISTKPLEHPYCYKIDKEVTIIYNKNNFRKNYILSLNGFWLSIISYLTISLWFSFPILLNFNSFFNVKNSIDYNYILSLISFFLFTYLFIELYLKFDRVRKLKIKGIVKEGRIIDFVKTRDHDNELSYLPVIEIINSDITFTGQKSYLNKDEINKKIEVLVDVDNHEFAEANTFFALWGEVLVLSLFSLCFLVLSIYSLLCKCIF